MCCDLYRFLVCYCVIFFSCQTKKDQEEEEVDIATCSRGQYFGELALVTNKPRAASAYAVGKVKCLGKYCAILHSPECKIFSIGLHYSPLISFFSFELVMDVKAFERLLGPCMDIMKRNIANYEEQLVTLFGSERDWEADGVRWLQWIMERWMKNVKFVWMFSSVTT